MAPPAIQGVQVPNSKVPGYSAIYRNTLFAEKLQPYETSEVTTLFESFERSVRNGPKHDCLGHREYSKATGEWGPYVWQTYEQIHKRRNDFGSGVLQLFEQFAKVSISLLIPLILYPRTYSFLSSSLCAFCRVFSVAVNMS